MSGEKPHLHEQIRQHACSAGTASEGAALVPGWARRGGREVLQARGLQPARHDGVAGVPHGRGGSFGGGRVLRGGGGGARAAAGEALRPPLRRQLGGWVGSRESRGGGAIRPGRVPDLRSREMRGGGFGAELGEERGGRGRWLPWLWLASSSFLFHFLSPLFFWVSRSR